ncbi:MAG: CotH kinase family protein [Ignavibacteriaceae bacterium]|nr:CotH kinase family protein [Ignavibacteriaceae bacterium]
MKTIWLLPLLILGFNSSILSQAPDNSWKLYDDSRVGRIDVTIDPAAVIWLYQNVTSDSEFVASMRFRNAHIDETVESIGFRLRGNTSRFSQKKSFKVSFNTFVQGREFYGVDKLNLNGEHNDPSIIRSKLCFDHFDSADVHASRAAHFEVYINNKYYGLYISVEHVDDEFLTKNFSDDTGNLWKCLYGADLQYLGENQTTYKNLNNNGTPAYELTTNETAGDYSQLVRLIRIINNTPSASFADSIEKILDVPDVLNYFALNVLMGSWDDYRSLMNNYYLYYEPSADKFHLIPYDYDNTYGIDWSGKNWTTADPYNFPKVVSGPRPLAEKLMGNNQYRDLFTRFLHFYSARLLPLTYWEDHIDTLRARIASSAMSDTFRTKDYGFTANDFFNSYTSGNYSNQHVKYGLKQFVNLRLASIPSQLSYTNAAPIAYRIDHLPRNPGAGDTVNVYVSAFSPTALAAVKIQFQKTGSAVTEEYNMAFTPVANTKKVHLADLYTGRIPPLGQGGSGLMRILVRDAQGREVLYPRNGPLRITVSSSGNSVVINEFLADNSASTPDPSGDHDDWLEIYNPLSTVVDLRGMYLTDNPGSMKKWRFPLSSIPLNPGERIVVWCDEEPQEPGYHSNFKLSKGGEFIGLTDSSGTVVLDSIFFGPQQTDVSYGRYPDGAGSWRQLYPSPGLPNSLTDVRDDDRRNDNSMRLYPNPAAGALNILLSLDQRRNGSLRLYDILGREIKILFVGEFEPGENSFKINVTDLAKGVYFIKINGETFEKGVKFVIL